ncbi:MAG TPA: ATP-binding protein, partial [Opitutus sp.]|nr:ATP-binding protein [Opitutus sp.]
LSLFRSHALGIAVLDREGTIHEHNHRLAELLNCREEPCAVAALTGWIAERERPAFLRVLAAQAAGAAPGTHEFTVNVPERGARLFRISTGWVRETGQICACLEDVTEQRALERNALRQEKQVLLDTLVGGIAHELNNKLTPVQGFSELLSLDARPGAQNYADLISQSVAEAARIIRQLLELSRPVSHVSQLLDLRTVVEEALVMLKFQVREAGCRVHTVLSPAPVFVSADVGQLKQVALNLIINALHAMEGKAERDLTVEVASDGTGARLSVKDTGCGISAENLERIFDPFFTTKGPERGTGLGLSICFSLVRQHGGEIAVVSEPGAGSTFTVSLPLQTSAPLFAPPLPSEKPAPEMPQGGRVLVVEDEVVVRRLMQEILCTRFGCQVDVASNGQEALAFVQQHRYALVLTDIRMPEMDGPGLYLKLRESRPELAGRLVFVTGHPGEKELEAQIEQWNVPVIAKPFSLSRLTDVCRPYLENHAALAV